MQRRRRVVEQLADKLMDRHITDMVIVVQDKDKWLGDVAQFIDQCGGQISRPAAAGACAAVAESAQAPGNVVSNGSDKIAEENDQLVVRFVEGEPGDRPTTVLQPLRDREVLPAPADATISVSVASGRSASLSIKRWRGTKEDAGNGLRSFVRNKGNDRLDMERCQFSGVMSR